MKNKKGFTLIELIAVIVILIIIFLIGILFVRRYTQSSKEKALKANAVSYVKSANILSAGLRGGREEILNGTFTTTELDDMGINVSGQLPSSGYVIFKNYEVRCACLQYNKSIATYKEDTYESNIKGKCDIKKPLCGYSSSNVEIFEYTGDVQEFIAPENGSYRLEVWGAQGGYRSNPDNGGKGGYSAGTIELQSGDVLYIYVGGSGNTGGPAGGYNGGGSKTTYPGGGGATDIRVEGNTLYHRIIVAGGGGSDGAASYPGKAGGGTSGVTATETNYCSGGEGGTQTSAGTRGSFGQGGSGGYRSDGWGGGGFGGAGGGGWYGGGGVNPDRSDDDRGGGGGSGFVYTDSQDVPDSLNYLVENHILTEAITIAGNQSTVPSYDGGGYMAGNSGNGYAKITYLNGDTDVTVTERNFYQAFNGFSKVEYIESHGQEYIQTSFKPNQDSGYEITFTDLDDISQSEGNFVFGARYAGMNKELSLIGSTIQSGWSGLFRYGTTNNNGLFAADEKVNIRFLNRTYSNGERSYYVSSQTFEAPVNIAVFSMNTNGTIHESRSSVRLYDLTFYSGSNKAQHYIPCIRLKDHEVGLCETFYQRFYPNLGEGQLTAGPIID